MYTVGLQKLEHDGGHGLGRACGHIKVFWTLPIPRLKDLVKARLLDRHALRRILGALIKDCHELSCL